MANKGVIKHFLIAMIMIGKYFIKIRKLYQNLILFNNCNVINKYRITKSQRLRIYQRILVSS